MKIYILRCISDIPGNSGALNLMVMTEETLFKKMNKYFPGWKVKGVPEPISEKEFLEATYHVLFQDWSELYIRDEQSYRETLIVPEDADIYNFTNVLRIYCPKVLLDDINPLLLSNFFLESWDV